MTLPTAGPRFIVGPTVAKPLAVLSLVLAFLYGEGLLSAAAVAIGWFAMRSLSCLVCSSIWRSFAWGGVLLGGLGVLSALIT